MDKVIVRTKALSAVLFSLATAGCDTVEVSAVGHAIKVEGKRVGEDERITLHVWSKEAEDTEGQVGKGEALTEEEVQLLDQGKCPKCPEHGQLYKGPKSGLAIGVSCDAAHLFWIPPPPFLPEYLGKAEELQAGAKEQLKEEGSRK